MKLRNYSLIALLCGFISTAIGIVAPFIYASVNDIGALGSTDSYSYSFVVFHLMNGLPFCFILFGISFVITALFCLIFSKTVKSSLSLKTSAISLCLSAVGALGLTCALNWFSIAAFNEVSKYPIEYPASILLGFASFFAFIMLIALYLKSRCACWSVKGFVIDVLTSIMYLPAFFFACSYLYNVLN